jgi:hypothetical protein
MDASPQRSIPELPPMYYAWKQAEDRSQGCSATARLTLTGSVRKELN